MTMTRELPQPPAAQSRRNRPSATRAARRVAILEDDPAQADLLTLWLAQSGYRSHVFGFGREFIRTLAHESFDMMLLDWELPDISGAEVIAWISTHQPDHPPVIFTTARGSEEDIARILNGGADDYLVKPLRKLELLARIDAVARRSRHSHGGDENQFSLADFLIDTDARIVWRAGLPIELTQKDFDLAAFLLRNPGRLLSRGHILEAVWGHSANLNTRTIDTHMSRLRGKLGLSPDYGWRLMAVYQHGYRLEPTGTASKPWRGTIAA